MTEAHRPTSPACDFCEAPTAAYAYPVDEISIGAEEETIPAAYWTACLDCYRLIEDQDWEGLTTHVGYPPGFSPTHVTAFQEHRRGGAVPLVTEG